MKLELEYLYTRYEYWRDVIGKSEIWNAELFGPVTIEIKRKSRCYNGMFTRRIVKRGNERHITDKIKIYNNVEDFQPEFLDSVLVHEMIHQYLIQNHRQGRRPHGREFQEIRKKINHKFGNKLKISVTDRNPSSPDKGEGDNVHVVLIVVKGEKFYNCVIHPDKVKEFTRKVRGLIKTREIDSYFWGVSNDVYFDKFRRCVKALSGQVKKVSELETFIKEYSIKKI